MCGIVGIVHGDYNEPVAGELLQRMIDSIHYRGPDDQGIWLADGVGLGHKRLTIIDLVGGHQPMCSAEGRMCLTYNGEVYNYIELRSELEKAGSCFSTQSDTEVLLHAYARYGKDCLQQLNGMFSFAIWDVEKRELFAARDRFGIKPFYYYWDGELFVFASEVKALLCHPKIAPQINEQALQDYLELQYCLGDKTLFKGVRRLLPGTSLTLRDGDLELSTYWDMSFAPGQLNQNQVVERIEFLLEDAVRLRLRSDVPVGSHLSGGLDSSAIAALAARQLPFPLQVFTGGFRENERYDESRYARLVAEKIGAEYHEFFPTAQNLADTFEDLIYYLDEPVAGAAVFPQYFLSKLASQHVKVVLGGQGADETFCGYARYLVAYLEACLQKSIYGSAPLVEDCDLSMISANLSYLRGYEPMMQNQYSSGLFTEPALRYYQLLRRSDGMENIVQGGNWRSGDYSTREVFRAQFDAIDSPALIDRMLYFDMKNHLQSLLHLEDRTSMAVSLESRLPLLDYRLVEAAFAAPASMRFAGGRPKFLLRAAVRNIVPREIVERKDKMGFPVPIYEWFRGELKPFVEDILLGQRTRERGLFCMAEVERCVRSERPFGRTVWGLLSLELWFRRFVDGN
jgi:asparagine synthase (glutamine-hydrolysing)